MATPLYRLTTRTLAVLSVLLREEHAWYGLAIAEQLDCRTGSVYPILARLESAGWVTSRWEDSEDVAHHGPRRKFFSLTPDGRERAMVALRARQQKDARQQQRAALLSRAQGRT